MNDSARKPARLSDGELLHMATAGASLRCMIARTHMSQEALRRRLELLEVEVGYIPFPHYSRERSALMTALREWYEAGASIAHLMGATKMTYPVVRRMLEEAGTRFRTENRASRSPLPGSGGPCPT
ncbi:helix-turn-helix domain-containing protein [Streptomyces sp. MS19]|uniref:helix-turn-helix domain-containing protein n=1 Tax=Streptomyces sp. MS19 TaxID=3385972 RepID=UPI00399F9B46